ncbi:META domain-containing protein [Pseudoalteromonas arabiensis]|uniref:META domain-containing protein n=1 Tax=unclassified Pseudoalteromonas TaxID=194690 RepID=UPI0024E1578E|nr:META domain-containing protein [Lelliottia steviae]
MSSEHLKYTQWQLSKINGLSIPVSQSASMRFIEAMQINGFAGCNKFFGEGQLVEDTLKVNKLGMTRKSCGEKVDELEQKLLMTLKQGAAISLNDEKLVLQGEHHFTFIVKN